jgi:hypothetical protein
MTSPSNLSDFTGLSGSYFDDDIEPLPPPDLSITVETHPPMIFDSQLDGKYLADQKTKLNEYSATIGVINSSLKVLTRTIAATELTEDDKIELADQLRRLEAASQGYKIAIEGIKQTKDYRAAHSPEIAIPEDCSDGPSFESTKVHKVCSPCGNAAFPATTFESFIYKLCAYGQRKRYSHDMYISAMLILLHGDVLTNFISKMKNNTPFPDILKQMSAEYIPEVTIHHHINALFAFARNPNEPIATAMKRFNDLLQLTAIKFNKDEREARADIERKKTLSLISSPAGKARLQKLIAKSANTGQPLTFAYMLQEAGRAEKNARDTPKVSTPTKLAIMSIEMEYAKQISAADGPQEQQLLSDTTRLPESPEAKNLVNKSMYVDSPVNWPPDAIEKLQPITQPNVASMASHEHNVGKPPSPRNIKRNNASYRSRNKRKQTWASQDDFPQMHNAKRVADATHWEAEKTQMSQSLPNAPIPSFWDPLCGHEMSYETVPCQKSTTQFQQPEN